MSTRPLPPIPATIPVKDAAMECIKNNRELWLALAKQESSEGHRDIGGGSSGIEGHRK